MAFDESLTGGTTSKIIEVMLRDSTTGGGKTGLAYGDVAASYVREGGTRVAITLASGTAGDAYSSGKWAEVDSTNQKGLYQLHLPNAAIASGVAAVTVSLQASGTLDKAIRLKLETPVNTVQLGGTTQTARDIGASVLISSGTGTGQLSLSSGLVTVGTNNDKTGYSISGTKTTLDALNDIDGTGLATSAGLATVDSNVDAIKAKTDQFVFTVANQVDANALSGGGGLDAAGIRSAVGLASANLDTQLGDIPTVSEFNARTLLASAYFDASADTVNLAADQSGVTIGTVNALTGHTVQTGDSYARLGAPAGASVSADIAAIEAGTAPTAAQVADAVWTEAIADHSGTVGSTAESLSNASAPTAGAVADAVWDEAMSGHVSVGSFGYWFSGITRLASWLGIIAGKTADASTLTEVNATTAGASFNNTTDSQEAIRDRGDAAWLTGSVTGDAIITPLSASEITRVNGTDIAYFIGETIATTIAITDSSGAALDVSAKTLQIVIDRGRSGHTDVQVISSGSISVGGASNNQVTFTNSAAVTATAGVLRWALRDTADGDRVLARGNIRVSEAADQDA